MFNNNLTLNYIIQKSVYTDI